MVLPLGLLGLSRKLEDPCHTLFQCTDGRIMRCHVDHVHTRTTPSTTPEDDFDIPFPISSTVDQPIEAACSEPRRSTWPRKPPFRYGVVPY